MMLWPVTSHALASTPLELCSKLELNSWEHLSDLPLIMTTKRKRSNWKTLKKLMLQSARSAVESFHPRRFMLDRVLWPSLAHMEQSEASEVAVPRVHLIISYSFKA